MSEEPTYAVTVVLTLDEVETLWSFAGMFKDDPGAIRSAWTWGPDPESTRRMEQELDDAPGWAQATIAAAGSGFRKLFRVLDRLPDVKLGPRRLSAAAIEEES